MYSWGFSTSVADFANPAIAPYIEKTQQSPAVGPKDRVKLFKLACSVAKRLTMSTVRKSMHGGHTLLECASMAGAFAACCHAGGEAWLRPPKAGARLPHSKDTHRTPHHRPLAKREE